MKTHQIVIENKDFDRELLSGLSTIDPQLILVFCSVEFINDTPLLDSLKSLHPDSVIAGCSTAGEITSEGVSEQSAVITGVHFDKDVQMKVAEAEVTAMQDSEAAGIQLGQSLKGFSPNAVLLFGKGLEINGSAVIEGLISELGTSVPITGGLAGDNGAFQETFSIGPSGHSNNGLVAIALQGENLLIGHGSYGGWAPFGPVRKVTRCEANVLYELDGAPALQIYKDYLGEYADQLPSSGLLFPFEMLAEDESQLGLIRTILGIDEEQGSLILAGAIDPNGYLRLMHASSNSLADGAEEAAKLTLSHLPQAIDNSLAILVSCVGRKLVMGDQVEDEVDAVVDTLGSDCTAAGFYSYGEIAPFSTTTDCKLHNQTMTVTLIGEK